MCCRYYVDDDTAKEIEKIIEETDRRGRLNTANTDVHPTEQALVLQAEKDCMIVSTMQWGFPQYNRCGVIFNARAESVLEKKTFSESALYRRCLIPAKGFYEWDHMKNKNTFERPDKKIMFMAGIWNYYDSAKRFVIITTDANDSMKQVHDRMPLILEEAEIEQWLCDKDAAEFLLHKKPRELVRVSGYVQETLPGV